MKSDLLEYKGYYGSVQYSKEDECLFGKIEFIDDLVLYEAENTADLKRAFQEAVDDYLERCKKAGQQPNETWKGSLNVRIGAELHKKSALLAKKNGQSLNDFIKDAVQAYVAQNADHDHSHVKSSGERPEHLVFTRPSKDSSYEDFASALMSHFKDFLTETISPQPKGATLYGSLATEGWEEHMDVEQVKPGVPAWQIH